MLKGIMEQLFVIFIGLLVADIAENLSIAMWQYEAGYEKFNAKVILERLYYAELFAFGLQ